MTIDNNPTPEELKLSRRASRTNSLFAPRLLKTALKQSVVMLRPDIQWKNPVMFVVEVGTLLSILYTVAKAARPGDYQASLGYLIPLDICLVLTLLFANFASSLGHSTPHDQA